MKYAPCLKCSSEYEQLLNNKAILRELVIELAAWHEVSRPSNVKIPSNELQDIVWAMMESLDMLEDAPARPAAPKMVILQGGMSHE